MFAPPTLPRLSLAPASQPPALVLNDPAPPQSQARPQTESQKLSHPRTGIGWFLVRYVWVQDLESRVDSGVRAPSY